MSSGNLGALDCEIEEIIELRTIALSLSVDVSRPRGRGHAGWIELHFGTVQLDRDGKVTQRKIFLDGAEALEAAGLEE